MISNALIEKGDEQPRHPNWTSNAQMLSIHLKWHFLRWRS